MTVLQKTTGHALNEICPGLWQVVFHFPVTTNCWLWEDADGLTLVDAALPSSAPAILAAIKFLNKPLKRIVITHAHPDHAGAAAEVSAKTDALVLAHEREIPYLTGKTTLADLPGYWACRWLLGAGKKLGILAPPPVENVRPLEEGESVGNLKVLATPGHTPGSISLWSDQKSALFCGDNMAYTLRWLHIGLPWYTLDHATQSASLRRYRDLKTRLVLCGHGPAYQGDISAVKFLLNRSGAP